MSDRKAPNNLGFHLNLGLYLAFFICNMISLLVIEILSTHRPRKTIFVWFIFYHNRFINAKGCQSSTDYAKKWNIFYTKIVLKKWKIKDMSH